mmetsp:Transcript_64798/g.198170  ORF Transcript_64798/g.198170 Transcript_64798/m.198170 type:complete len:266 (+) Transcript_64798:96-893(+)
MARTSAARARCGRRVLRRRRRRSQTSTVRLRPRSLRVWAVRLRPGCLRIRSKASSKASSRLARAPRRTCTRRTGASCRLFARRIPGMATATATATTCISRRGDAFFATTPRTQLAATGMFVISSIRTRRLRKPAPAGMPRTMNFGRHSRTDPGSSRTRAAAWMSAGGGIGISGRFACRPSTLLASSCMSCPNRTASTAMGSHYLAPTGMTTSRSGSTFTPGGGAGLADLAGMDWRHQEKVGLNGCGRASLAGLDRRRGAEFRRRW